MQQVHLVQPNVQLSQFWPYRETSKTDLEDDEEGGSFLPRGIFETSHFSVDEINNVRTAKQPWPFASLCSLYAPESFVQHEGLPSSLRLSWLREESTARSEGTILKTRISRNCNPSRDFHASESLSRLSGEKKFRRRGSRRGWRGGKKFHLGRSFPLATELNPCLTRWKRKCQARSFVRGERKPNLNLAV